MFNVEADHHHHLLRIKMWGFWDAPVMAAYTQAVGDKMRQLRQAAGCTAILIDMVDYPIQSQEIAEQHASYLRFVKERGEARVALVMQNALSKLQAARVAHDTGHATFETEAEALAWLKSMPG